MEHSLKNKKVLVTGAGGFIGSHLTETLVKEGANVRAFIRYNSRQDIGLLKFVREDVLNEVEIYGGDLQDETAVQKAVEDVDIIFHLGAHISIPYSYKHPREVIETNVIGTLNVLEAGLRHGVERIIHTSTSEVYGTALYVPIDEKHPLQGQSPYSASKIGADKIAESFFRAFDAPVITVRPFNTYGPRQSARAVIPTIITQALTQETIMLGALDTRRDFTYVNDTVCGFLKAATADDQFGETFNLGTGEEIEIGEIASLIIEAVGRDLEIEIDPNRLRPSKSEVRRLLSDNQKAKHGLGWQPETSMKAGLSETINWIRDNLETFQSGKYVY